MATCDELSKDLQAIDEIQKLYWTLEKSATPTALLLPWFPSKAKKNREIATGALFMKLKSFVDLRREAKVPSADAIDLLIGQGLSDPEIVQVCQWFKSSVIRLLISVSVHPQCRFRRSN
jgi:hypothetical protein